MEKKKVVRAPDAAIPQGPYSQAVVYGGLVYVSGQCGHVHEATSENDIESQTRHALECITHILREAGSDITKVLKTTCYLGDMADYASFNRVYEAYFKADPPARATVSVRALPGGAKIEIDVIAHV